MTTDFVFHGRVVSRYRCRLSAFAIRYIRSQLSDFWGALEDSDIVVVEY